jgi:hypothetical protein
MDAELEFDGDTPADRAASLREFQRVLPAHLESAMDDVVTRIQADAARNAPVDTGRLRASIESLVEQIAADVIKGTVGSNLDYAPEQEIRTGFLRDAIESNRQWIVERIEQAVEAAWEDAL